MDRAPRLNEPDAALGALGAIGIGKPWPMGASVDVLGVNFAVCSVDATAIELCLFDADGHTELARMPLPGRSGDVWHGHLPGARAGQLYGLRAHGAWQPDLGLRFNPHKLLLDPWGREIVGTLEGHDIHRGDDPAHPQQRNDIGNSAVALKSRVVDDGVYDWQGDRALHLPFADSVIYEVHVRGFTRRMPGVPDAQRGSYAGMASDAAIGHLQRLGITAVCMLPVQRSLSEHRLVEMGLQNYWGYNTIGFFCPDPRLASSSNPRDEFREMVRRLHAAGIEVLLDVVYNHSAEGDETGPTLCWRGLDNRHWYRLPAERPGGYENHSGCGNTFDIRQPRVLQMVLDSLRYWVEAMHVDGFRFDLAPVLGRGNHSHSGNSGFERDGPFFKALQQDPLLQRVKLIAEPWDIGPGGYQLGQFPRGWLEWNDRFRDTVRSFWLHGEGTRAELALRLAGSADLYQTSGRTPLESVNYVVSHDGFTLADLVRYDWRHNQANGEDNRDGHAHNLSWNCGVEGPTDDPAVNDLRRCLQRALLATVLLSQGTPMLAAGDELGHSQGGNNNPYCQDNDTTWIDWAAADHTLSGFTARLLDVRRRLLPRGARWFTGVADAQGRTDLSWLRSDGEPMQPDDWQNPFERSLQAWFGCGLLLLINAGTAAVGFKLPAGNWLVALDTGIADGRSPHTDAVHNVIEVAAHCLVLLQVEGATSNC